MSYNFHAAQKPPTTISHLYISLQSIIKTILFLNICRHFNEKQRGNGADILLLFLTNLHYYIYSILHRDYFFTPNGF